MMGFAALYPSYDLRSALHPFRLAQLRRRRTGDQLAELGAAPPSVTRSTSLPAIGSAVQKVLLVGAGLIVGAFLGLLIAVFTGLTGLC